MENIPVSFLMEFRTEVVLSGRRDALSALGVIWADLPASETLPIFAQVWGATAPPTGDEAWVAWISADVKAQEGARQWLRSEVAENIPLFDARMADWLSARASRADPLVLRT